MWEKTSGGAGRGTESCGGFLVASRRSLYPRIGRMYILFFAWSFVHFASLQLCDTTA
jgi:hypothetical protein